MGPLFLGPQPSEGGRSHRAGVIEVEGQTFRPTAWAHQTGIVGAGCVILIIVDLIVVIVRAVVG